MEFFTGGHTVLTRILFVCHGNICRSPAAEFVFRDLLSRAGLSEEFQIESAATSSEEIGNPVYPPMRRVLEEHNYNCSGKTARRIVRSDYEQFDLIIAMDEANIRGIHRIAGGDPEKKIQLLLDYAGEHRNVADPWYTRDFETAYNDIFKGCRALLAALPNS